MSSSKAQDQSSPQKSGLTTLFDFSTSNTASIRELTRHTSLKSTLQSILKSHQETLLELLGLIKKSTSQTVLNRPSDFELAKSRQKSLLKKLESLQEELDFYSKDICKHQELSKKIYEHDTLIDDLTKDTSDMISLLGKVYHDSYNIQRNLQKAKTGENNYLSRDEIMIYAEKIAYVIAAPPDFKEGETVLTQFKPPYPREAEWMHSLLYEHNTLEFLKQQKANYEKLKEEQKGEEPEAPTLPTVERIAADGGMVDTMQLMTQKRMEMQREKERLVLEEKKVTEPEKKISLFGMEESSEEDSDED